MFKRVLVSLDLSPATEALVSALPGLKEFGTEEINLAHAVKDVEYPISQTLSKTDDTRKRLRALGQRLEEHGFQVTVDVVAGGPATEITRVARQREADVILVGTRSHSRIYEAFVGSVAWEIVRRARRPVLLQRIEANRPDPEAALESPSTGLPDRVVHATDLSETAQRAIPWLEELARVGVGSFTLVHSLTDEGEESREDVNFKLEGLAGQLRAAGASEVQVEIRRGSPADSILALGGRDPRVMVVMGTHGRAVLPEMVLGSESRQVVRQAAARVLLIPRPDVEEE